MSKEELKGILLKVLESFSEDEGDSEAYVSTVNANLDDILAIVEQVKDIFRDGIQLSDISAVGGIVPDIMKLVAAFDWEGKDKKQFVIDVVWLIYQAVDTYPDGKQNNINLPVVWGDLERRVERAIVVFGTSMAVDAAFDRMRAAGEV